jgi:FkbM family methyltransferase
MLNKFKLTKIRLRIAKLLFWILHVFYKNNEVVVTRSKIKYALNISEAIDLSIFLFGSFQKTITNLNKFNLQKQMVIFDIGANIGCITLKIAKTNESARIYSFEPTDYAFIKLIKNIKLNPALERRIYPVKLYFSDLPQEKSNLEIYSSWKVDDFVEKAHPIHGGIKQNAEQIQTTTIDIYCRQNNIINLDFIKIDTDGHELPILHGAQAILNSMRPVVVFEIGLYLLNERGISFNDYYIFFIHNNYEIYDLKIRKNVNPGNCSTIIPEFSTIDLVAIPNEKINDIRN